MIDLEIWMGQTCTRPPQTCYPCAQALTKMENRIESARAIPDGCGQTLARLGVVIKQGNIQAPGRGQTDYHYNRKTG